MSTFIQGRILSEDEKNELARLQRQLEANRQELNIITDINKRDRLKKTIIAIENMIQSLQKKKRTDEPDKVSEEQPLFEPLEFIEPTESEMFQTKRFKEGTNEQERGLVEHVQTEGEKDDEEFMNNKKRKQLEETSKKNRVVAKRLDMSKKTMFLKNSKNIERFVVLFSQVYEMFQPLDLTLTIPYNEGIEMMERYNMLLHANNFIVIQPFVYFVDHIIELITNNNIETILYKQAYRDYVTFRNKFVTYRQQIVSQIDCGYFGSLDASSIIVMFTNIFTNFLHDINIIKTTLRK